MSRLKCLAVLETMWGDDWTTAPKAFRISEYNHTGKRLYWFLGHDSLLVTNACKEYVPTARDHGTPNKNWLESNLNEFNTKYKPEMILFCGKVVKDLVDQINFETDARIVYIPHPANRIWNRQALDACQRLLQNTSKDAEFKLTRYNWEINELRF